MSKAVKRARARQKIFPQYFIFEIKDLGPTYILSVDHDKYRKAAYSEAAGVEFQGLCVFPNSVAGRSAAFYLAGRRDCLVPDAYKNDNTWVPRCIGELELKPDGGHFYTSVPHESIAFLTTLLTTGIVKYILLYGAPLSRGRSLCSSMQLEKTVNLEDY